MKIFTSYNFGFSNCLQLYRYQAKNYSQILNKVDNNNTIKNKVLKKLVKGLKNFVKKRKTKSNNMVTSNIKMSQEMKNKGQLSIEKNVIKNELMFTNE